MATLRQNQAQAGPPINMLREQSIPNTLGGIGPSTTAVRLGISRTAFVAAAVVVASVLVLLVAR
jgi:hypothetical protein